MVMICSLHEMCLGPNDASLNVLVQPKSHPLQLRELPKGNTDLFRLKMRTLSPSQLELVMSERSRTCQPCKHLRSPRRWWKAQMHLPYVPEIPLLLLVAGVFPLRGCILIACCEAVYCAAAAQHKSYASFRSSCGSTRHRCGTLCSNFTGSNGHSCCTRRYVQSAVVCIDL